MSYVFKKSDKFVDKKGNAVTDPTKLKYLKSIYVPPAYSNVAVYLSPNSKILAKGTDTAGRLQYIYNKKFIEQNRKHKFCNLVKFGSVIPKIKARINKFLDCPHETKGKMVALVLLIIVKCNFRVGNEKYQQRYNSHGASTLQRNHLSFNRSKNTATIKFVGKKGIINQCDITDARMVRELRTLYWCRRGEQRLFTYKDKNNESQKTVKAEDINNFLKSFGEFTSKFFRTWEANILLLKKLLKMPDAETITARKRQLSLAVKQSAEKLHHTAAICRKNYLLSELCDYYVNNRDQFEKLKSSKRSVSKIFTMYIQDNAACN